MGRGGDSTPGRAPALAHPGAATDLCQRGLESGTKGSTQSALAGAHGREGRQLPFVIRGYIGLANLAEWSDLLKVTLRQPQTWLMTGQVFYLPSLRALTLTLPGNYYSILWKG